jgi:cobalt-zinc-cadmium efflux system protein
MHSHHHHHGEQPAQAGHHHALPDSRRILLIAIALNLIFVAIEFSWGILANSTALLADAGHNLSDVLGLALSLAAIMLTKKQASGPYTYGLRSSSILAALANAMLLLLACCVIAWEALHRILQPASVDGMTVVIVASLAIAVNGFSAWLLIANSKHDMNIRAAFLHMALDAAVSFAVVLGGVIVIFTGWSWFDPAISLLIVLVVLFSTWGLLRDAVRLALSAVPPHIDLQAVKHYLLQQPGVQDIEDLHIWGMSTTETALTAHLIMPQGSPGDDFIRQIAQELEHDFAIHHVTVQIVTAGGQGGCQRSA